MREVKSSKNNSMLQIIKKGLSVFLATATILTGIDLSAIQVNAAPGNNEAEAYPCTLSDGSINTAVISSLTSSGLVLGDGSAFDPSKSYEAGTVFQTSLDFVIDQSLISSIIADASIADTDSIYFEYTLPDNVKTSGAMGTSGAILGSLDNGTYTIGDGKVYFIIKKQYFNNHTSGVGVQFEYSFVADDSKIDDGGKTEVEFAGTGTVVPIKTEKPGATGWKGSSNAFTAANGKSYIPYTISLTTNSRSSKNFTITDTPGSNMSVDLSDANTGLVVKYKGAALSASQYNLVQVGDGFKVEITDATLGSVIDAKSAIEVTYNAAIKDPALDSNGDGKVDGTQNTATWSADGNTPADPLSATPQIDVSGAFKLDKSSSVSGAKANWTVALNTTSMPVDMGGYTYTDTLVAPSEVDLKYSDVVIKNAAGVTVATIPASTLEANSGNFSYTFPADAGAQKYTISYSTEVVSAMSNGDKVDLKNTAIVKDPTSVTKGTDVEIAKITKSESVGVSKKYVGDFQADYTQAWETTITPDANDGLTNGLIYDRLSAGDNSWDTYYGSTFVEDSIVVKIQGGATLVNGVDYTVTFKKSDSATAAGAAGNDIFEIQLINGVKYTAEQPIIVSYVTQDDGSNLDMGKNLNNYTHVQTATGKYPATANKYVSKSSIQHSMYKKGTFSADKKSIDWEVWTNSQNTWDREGINDFAGKTITIEDSLPEHTEYIADSVSLKLYYGGGNYDGYDVSGFATNYDKDARKLTITVPYSVLQAASPAVNGKFILCTKFKSTVDTYKSIKNIASYSANGKKVDQTDCTVKNDEGNLLNKAGAISADNQKILYTVDVNPSAYDYDKKSDVLELRDDLPAGSIESGSVVIVDSLGNDLLATGQAKYTYKSLDNQLFFTVPDGVHVIISYTLIPDLSGFPKNPDGTYKVENLYNNIKCTSTTDGDSSSKGISGSMTSSAATMKGRTLTINKADASDTNKKLGGATFKLQKFDVGTSTFTDIVAGDAITVNKDIYTTSTADSFVTATGTGVITYANLQYDTIYSFCESKPPVGYDLDSTVRYVILIHDAATSNAALTAFTAATGLPASKVKNIAEDNNVLFTDTSDGKTLTDIKKVDKDGNVLPGATLAVYTTEAGTALDYDAQLDGVYYKRKEMVGTSWVSGSDVHSISELTADAVYILHEISAPAGYKIAADVAFKVKTAGTSTKVSMVDEKTVLEVEKKEVDPATSIIGAYVAGATLKVIDEATGTEVVSWVTSATKYTIEGKLSAGKIYILRETDVPSGYKAAEDIRFKVSDDGKTYINLADDSLITTLTMLDPISTTVKVAKKDSSGKLISGAKLQILDNAGNVVPLPDFYDTGKDYWTTDGTEKVITGLPTLAPGENYRLHELEAPTGYVLAADKLFTLTSANRTVELTMTDALAKSFILKVDKTDGTIALPGAKLQLLDADKKVVSLSVYDSGKNYWTSDGTTKSITDLKAGVYYIHELEAPKGYSGIAADIKVEFKESDTVLQKTVEVINTKINAKLSLYKVTDTNVALPGAEFEIYEAVLDGSGNPKKTGGIYDKKGVAIWSTTGANWSVTTADVGLVVGKTYIIKETVVPTLDPLGNPATYLSSAEVAVKIVAGENKVTITNTLLATPKYPFAVHKVDSDGMSVAGAKLEIYSAVLSGSTYIKKDLQTVKIDSDTATDVTSWLSGSTANLIYGLTTGDYYLHEAAVPTASNYKLAADILFHYDETTGKVTTYKGVTKSVTLTKDVGQIEMLDEYEPFHVEKRKVGTSTVLTGAVLTIYKASDLTTPVMVLNNANGDGKWDIDTTELTPGNYVLRETIAPLGYSKSVDIAFTVNSNNTVSYTYKGVSYVKVYSIYMEDSELSLKVNKTDGNGKALAGAQLQILDSDKNVITGLSIYDAGYNYWTTNATGSVVITGLSAGHYYLRELAAPAGYVKSSDIDFTMNEDGTVSYTYDGKTYSNVTAINMVDDKVNVSVLKTDMSNNMLPGATLDIYAVVAGTTYKVKDKTGAVVNVDLSGTSLQTITSLGTDSVDITATLTDDTYYMLVETTAPDGYYVADPIYFYYNLGKLTYYVGTTKYENVKQITMKDVATELSIKKLDENNNKALSGATFEIYEDTYTGGLTDHATTGAPIKTFVSGTTAEVIKALVVDKWYILKETKAPAGYTLAPMIAFKLESDGKVTYGTVNNASATDKLDGKVTAASLTVKDDKTSIKIDKKATSKTGASLPGATLVIKKGSTVVQTIKPNGSAVVVTGLAMDTEYTLSETVTPDGYAKSADIKFTIDSATGKIKITSDYKDSDGVLVYAAGTAIDLSDVLVMVDIGISKLAIKKTNAAGVGLPGAEFDIYQAIDSGLPATGGAPTSGYKTYDHIVGGSTEYTVDYVAKEEGGNWWYVASTVVEGTEGTAFTSDGTEKVYDSLTNAWLVPGKYILVEKSAPEGFERVEPMLITIDPAPSTRSVPVANKAKPSQQAYVRVNKVDDHGIAVKGARLELYNADSAGNITGTAIDTWITDGTAYVNKELKVGNYYILREVSAPVGYIISEDVLFQIETADVPTEVVMTDKRDTTVASLEIRKTVAGEPIAGAQFELTAKDNNVDFTKSPIMVTGSGTHLKIKKASISWVGVIEPQVIANLPNSTYVLFERVAPEVCETAATDASITFTVKNGKIVDSSKKDIFGYTADYVEDGNKNVIVVDNKSKGNLVKLSKMTNGFNLIAGAKMKLTCTDPSVDMRYVVCLSGALDYVHTATECTWTTTDTKIVLSNLEDKEYILTELEAPSGYLEAAPIHFTTEGGNIKTINGVPVDQYNCEMVDLVDPGEVTVTFFKADEDNHIKFLSGARFELYGDAACTELLGTAVSDAYGMVTFPNVTKLGKLYIKEVEAPEGYTLSTTIYVINVYKTYEGRSIAYETGFAGTTSTGYAIITNKNKHTGGKPEPTPEPEGTTITTNIPQPTPVASSGAPQTGDDSHPMMWLLIMLAGLATVVSSVFALKVRRK